MKESPDKLESVFLIDASIYIFQSHFSPNIECFDNKGGDLLDNEVAETIGTTLGFEESSELLASWVLFHAVWLWHNRNSKAIEFWRTNQAFRLVMGLLFLGIGTGFQAYKEFHFISNEISFLGIILMIVGALLVKQQLPK